MKHWIGRSLLAGWFVGMVVLAVVNRPQVEAEENGAAALYLPLVHADSIDGRFHDYVGLVRGCNSASDCMSNLNGDFYTVRGDGSEWEVLIEDTWWGQYWAENHAWSPDGAYFVYPKAMLEQTGQPVFTWIMSLDTRETRPLLQSNYVLRWSPDSQRLALISPTHLHIFEVSTQQITAIALPPEGATPLTNNIFWSENSQQLAWGAGSKIWAWNGNSNALSLVYEGRYKDGELYWSPDSSRLLINAYHGFTNEIALYETSTSGAPATLFLDGYWMKGWVANNQRMVLWHESQLYIAFPDGGSNYLYFNNALVDRSYVFPSPLGNWLGIGTTQGLYLKPVPNGMHTQIEYCNGVTWRQDGARFACVRSWFPMTRIGDVSSGTPIITEDLDMYGDPEFLTDSDSLISLNKYYISNSGGYPHPKFEASYLHLIGTPIFKEFRSPTNNNSFPVLEWRYIP